MHRLPLLACPLCLALLTWCGCDDLGPRRRPLATPPGAETAAAASDETAAAAGGTESAADATNRIEPEQQAGQFEQQTGAPRAQSPGTPAARSPQSDEGTLRLSAGVALPQSLPTGTAMGFSVDYDFIEGGPQPSYQYVWVIRAAQADQPRAIPVQLSGRDTLQTFVTDWQPRHGPFESFIAAVRPDGSREAVSPIEPLESNQ